MTVTVTDSRGRQATDTEVIDVLDYGLPVISAVTAFRSDAAGAVLQTGEYIAVKASLVVSPITGNSGTATVKKRITAGTWGTAVAITHNTTVVLDTALEENA
jgi:putative methionine-R-sulfoxide reductase with GAF domain